MFWVISDLGHISSFLYNVESWWIALNLLLLYFGLRKRDDELRKWVKGGRALRIHAAKLPSLEIHPGKFIGTYGRLYVSKSTVNWMNWSFYLWKEPTYPVFQLHQWRYITSTNSASRKGFLVWGPLTIKVQTQFNFRIFFYLVHTILYLLRTYLQN